MSAPLVRGRLTGSRTAGDGCPYDLPSALYAISVVLCRSENTVGAVILSTTYIPAAAIIARRRGVNRFALYETEIIKHNLKTSRKGYVIGLWFLQAGGVKGRETGNFPPLAAFLLVRFLFAEEKKMNEYPSDVAIKKQGNFVCDAVYIL